MRNDRIRLYLAVLVALLVSGCAATPALIAQPSPTVAAQRTFSGDAAYQDVVAQLALGPRPVGTPANRATADYIVRQLTEAGWSVERQTFTLYDTEVQNIIARSGEGNSPILLGAHYDTRPKADRDTEHPDQPVPGASDGASGVGVLLELARALDRTALKQPVWLTFFDAEDSGRIGKWDWSEGARYMASHLTTTPAAVVVIDMVGDADQQIYLEENSDAELNRQLWDVAKTLGISSFMSTAKWRMIDDHLPFRERGIPVALLIDFDYPYWHTVGDTADKVSATSLANVGRVLERWLEGK
jgi:glutaminyl-peptide cyclotransferase